MTGSDLREEIKGKYYQPLALRTRTGLKHGGRSSSNRALLTNVEFYL